MQPLKLTLYVEKEMYNVSREKKATPETAHDIKPFFDLNTEKHKGFPLVLGSV